VLESPLKLLARLPGPVRLLITGTLINKVGTFIVPYLTIVLFREFHLTETQVAELFSAYGAGSIVSILAGGFLTDRLGRRRTLMVSLFGSGVLAVGLGFAPSTRVFVPLLVLFGFVADLYRPAASAIIGDLLPSTHRVSGFAALRMAVNLGFAVGMAVGGLLADWSWRLLFFGDGLTTLIYGVVVYLFIPETRPETREGPAVPGLPPPPESPFRDGIYLQMTAVAFAFSLVFFSHISVMPLTITAAGYPALAYGLLVGLNGLLIALLEISLVEKLKPYRRLRVAALGQVLAGLGFGLTGLVLHWSWWLMSVLIWTAGEILSSPQEVAFIADWAPPAARGRYLSLFQASWSLALAINPILFLPIHATLGEPRFWALMFLIALPGAAVLVRLDRIADLPGRLRGLSLPPADPELLRAIAPEG
jgi:MFS family permease